MSGRSETSLWWMVLACVSVLAQEDAKRKLPKPLPKKVAAAWKAVGAETGWMGTNDISPLWFSEDGKTGDVPAFRLRARPKGGWPRLPRPREPFGLSIHQGAGDDVLEGLSCLR